MAAVRGGNLTEAAGAAGSEQAAFADRTASVGYRPGHRAAVRGIIAGVQPGSGELNRSAGEEHGVGGGYIVAVQLPGGLEGGGQEDGGAVGPLGAVGGPVNHLHPVGVRIGGADGGGAAAVHGDGLHAAQLHQALGRLGQGAAHAVAGLLAVQGVENHGAVGLDAHRRPGGALRRQAGGDHLAVGDDLISTAQRLGDRVPTLIGAGDGQGDRIARLEGAELGKNVGVVLGVHGEDGLALGDGDAAGGFQHLVHGVLYLLADGGLSGIGSCAVVHRGEDHVHAGVGVLSGGGKVRGEQGQPAAGVAGGDFADFVDSAAQLIGGAAEGDVGGEGGLTNEGGAVLVEADGPGVVVVGGGPYYAVSDQQAHRGAGGEHIPVSVDAGDHPLSLILQTFCHAGQGEPVQHLAAVSHGGHHVLVGSIGDVVLMAQIGVAVAPEDVFAQSGALRQGNLACVQIPAQGV